MDSDFIKFTTNCLADGIWIMILMAFIIGVCIPLLIGGLIWGGVYLYKNYDVVKTSQVEQNTNDVVSLKD